MVGIHQINLEEPAEESIARIVNSPRSLEAAQRQGINLQELDPVTEKQVEEMLKARERKPNVPKVLVEIRLNHLMNKRQEKLKLLIEEREYIIEEEQKFA